MLSEGTRERPISFVFSSPLRFIDSSPPPSLHRLSSLPCLSFSTFLHSTTTTTTTTTCSLHLSSVRVCAHITVAKNLCLAGQPQRRLHFSSPFAQYIYNHLSSFPPMLRPKRLEQETENVLSAVLNYEHANTPNASSVITRLSSETPCSRAFATYLCTFSNNSISCSSSLAVEGSILTTTW